jgi:hypothetical protein
MGCGGEDFEMLLREFGVGDGEEFGVPQILAGEVAKAEYAGGGCDGCGGWRGGLEQSRRTGLLA